MLLFQSMRAAQLGCCRAMARLCLLDIDDFLAPSATQCEQEAPARGAFIGGAFVMRQ